jgi:hypothetical protein
MPAQTKLPGFARRMPHGAIAMANEKQRRAAQRAAALYAPGPLAYDPDLPLIDPEFDGESETGIAFGANDRFF